MKQYRCKRIFAGLLSAAMMVTQMPYQAFAEEAVFEELSGIGEDFSGSIAVGQEEINMDELLTDDEAFEIAQGRTDAAVDLDSEILDSEVSDEVLDSESFIEEDFVIPEDAEAYALPEEEAAFAETGDAQGEEAFRETEDAQEEFAVFAEEGTGDESGPEYKVWFEELRDNEHESHMYTDETYEIHLNTDELGGVDYRIEWMLAHFYEDESQNEYFDLAEVGGSVSEDGSVLSVNGSIVKDYLKPGTDGIDVHVSVYTGEEGAREEIAWADLWLRVFEPLEEYEKEEDRTMLPGWNGTVNGSYDVYVEDADHPHGEETQYTVTNVEVVSDKPWEGEDGDVIIDFHPDQDQNDPDHVWWYYRTGHHGTAVLGVTYKDIYGEEKYYEFKLYVGGDVYSVFMDSAGGERSAFPGGEIELYAQAEHEYFDESGEYCNDDKGLGYEWFFEKGDEYAEIIVHDDDPSKATLKCKELPEGEDRIDEEVRIGVKIRDAEGNETEGYHSTSFWVRSGYTEVVPLKLDRNLAVGGAIKDAAFEVRRYQLGEDQYEVLDNLYDVCYEWHYDKNSIRVTEKLDSGDEIIKDGDTAQGKVFTITRLQDNHHDFRVRAYWTEDGEQNEVWGNYQLWGTHAEVWFEDDNDRIFSDGDGEWAFKSEGFALENVDMGVTVGIWDEDNDDWGRVLSEKDGYYGYDEETGKLTLHGQKLYEDGIDNIRLYGYARIDDNHIYDCDHWIHVEEAYSDYDFDWDEITMLPGWDHRIDRWQEARISSARVDGGEWKGSVEILGVKSSDEAVARIEYNEWDSEDYPEGKDHNWNVRAVSFGAAVITLTFRDWDNIEKTLDFQVLVSDEKFDVDVWTDDETNIVLPGGSIGLHVNMRHELYDPKTGEQYQESGEELAGKFHFVWNIGEDEQSQRWIDRIEPGPIEHGAGNEITGTATVFLKDLPEDWEDGLWQDLWVKVQVASNDNPDDIKAENRQRIAISDCYYEVWVPGCDDRLWPGQSVTVAPELRRYPSRDENSETGYDTITENVYFRWAYDDRAVEVLDENGALVGNYDQRDTGETDEDGAPVYEHQYKGSELSGIAGKKYTIRRLNNWNTRISLVIDYVNDGDEEDECEWERDFNEKNLDFWFETPGGNNIFRDGSRTVELNLDNYEDAPGDLYSLKYEVSTWYPLDGNFREWEERPLTEGFTVDGEGLDARLTMNGKTLAGVLPEGADHLKVIARVVLGEGDGAQVLEEREQDFWLKDPEFEHFNGVNFGNDNIFLGHSRILNGYYDGSWIRIRNSDYPDGEPRPFVITGVTAANTEEDPHDNSDVIGIQQFTQADGRKFWELTGERNGESLITLSLDILDPDTLQSAAPAVVGKTEVSYRMWVGDFDAWFDIKTETGSENVLAGNSIKIIPVMYAKRQNQENGDIEDVDTARFRIDLQARCDEIYEDEFDWDQDTTPGCELRYDEESGSWHLETDADAPDQRVRIEVRAYDHDDEYPEHEWECCYGEIRIEVAHGLNTIEITGWDENLRPGASAVITPVVKTVTDQNPEGEAYVSDDLFYRIEGWYESPDPDDPEDPSHFIITDSEGKKITYNPENEGEDGLAGKPPFTVKRLVSWDAGLTVAAFDRDRRGNEIEVARKRLYANRLDHPLTLEKITDEGSGITYWYCAHCGKYFSDENAENEVATDDIEQVKKAAALIAALTLSGMSEKEAVEAAEAAYKELDAAQQAMLSETAKKTLQDAKTRLDKDIAAAKADADAADQVTARLNALKTNAGISDAAAVEAARKAYDALTPDQKKLVSAEALKKLTDAEASVKAAKAAAEQAAKDAAAKAEQAAKEAAAKAEQAAKEAAARAAFDLNVKEGATVPVQLKKNVNKVIAKLGEGDAIASVTSSDDKIVKAGFSGTTITLKGLTNKKTAAITVTTALGATRTFKVKVQKAKVKTKKITVPKKVTVKIGTPLDLGVLITPVTTLDKLTIKSAKKAIAAVTNKGIITGKKPGKVKITVKSGTKKKVITVTVTQ